MPIYLPNDPAIVSALQSGAVGVIPTDTVYGLAARAEDPGAVAKLYHAKHREGKPGTVIAADVAQLVALGIDADQLAGVAHLWPDALSVVLPDHPELAYLDQGVHSLAVRIPKDVQVHELLVQTGPLLTSSANMPGQPVANSIEEAQNYFGETIDFYVDNGVRPQSTPSTVIRLSEQGDIEVLRPGAVQLP